MTRSDSSRLDRIEAMLETLTGAIEGLREGLAEVRKLTISNARAIEASREDFSQSRKQWQRDRDLIYQTMSDLANSQATLYQAQANYYN